jgi:hypothetical protein
MGFGKPSFCAASRSRVVANFGPHVGSWMQRAHSGVDRVPHSRPWQSGVGGVVIDRQERAGRCRARLGDHGLCGLAPRGRRAGRDLEQRRALVRGQLAEHEEELCTRVEARFGVDGPGLLDRRARTGPARAA